MALLAAAGACPPEDSGGAPGFDDLLAALADPAHARHAEVAEWMGGNAPRNPAADLPALAAAAATTAGRLSRRRRPTRN